MVTEQTTETGTQGRLAEAWKRFGKDFRWTVGETDRTGNAPIRVYNLEPPARQPPILGMRKANDSATVTYRADDHPTLIVQRLELTKALNAEGILVSREYFPGRLQVEETVKRYAETFSGLANYLDSCRDYADNAALSRAERVY
jgi:hypothetical protein